MNRSQFQTVILGWFTSENGHLQMAGGILLLMSIMMLVTSLPPQSTDGWFVAVLGSLVLLKGALTFTSAYHRSLRKTILQVLEVYKSSPILWSIHCTAALVVGIFLTVWGITHL